jgi:hypothetical protein
MHYTIVTDKIRDKTKVRLFGPIGGRFIEFYFDEPVTVHGVTSKYWFASEAITGDHGPETMIAACNEKFETTDWLEYLTLPCMNVEKIIQDLIDNIGVPSPAYNDEMYEDNENDDDRNAIPWWYDGDVY